MEGQSVPGAFVRAAALQPWLASAQEAAENTPLCCLGLDSNARSLTPPSVLQFLSTPVTLYPI